MALNPLSRTLKNTSYVYSIGRDEDGYQLSHLLYMDDQKLYASSRTRLQSVLVLGHFAFKGSPTKCNERESLGVLFQTLVLYFKN